MSVYTLELADGYFYVGYSDDVDRRTAEHFLGRGSMWTRLHPPVKVLSVVPGTKELENSTTIALMCIHGWRKVRGGAWCSIELKSMPLPLSRALASKPPPDIRVSGVSHDYNNHLIHVDGPPWNARVSGPTTIDRPKGSVDPCADNPKETNGVDTLADEDVSSGHQRED
jgi:hypothetical protein